MDILTGVGSFNIATGTGSFTATNDQLIDAYAQVIGAGIAQLKSSSTDLAKLSRTLPLIGKEVQGVIAHADDRRADIREIGVGGAGPRVVP